jgi:hypothetical protein
MFPAGRLTTDFLTTVKQHPYRIYQNGPTRLIVVENATEMLTPYRALMPIETPYFKVRISVGSILHLADETAEKMLADGGIEPVDPVELVPWRVGFERACARRYEARKLSRETVSRPGG